MAEKKREYKVKKKLSGGPRVFRKWGDWDVGDILIGKFVGTFTDRYNKECTLVEVVEAQFVKEKKLGKSLEGKILVLNACGKLNKARDEGMSEGDFFQVTYNGMGEIQGGKYAGKDAHDVDVDLLEDPDKVEDGDNPNGEEEEETEDEDFDL